MSGSVLLALVFFANLVVILGVRAFVAKRVGIGGVRFLFWSERQLSFEYARPGSLVVGALACAVVPYLIAVAFFTIANATGGELVTSTCVEVTEGGAAARAGMKTGDCIEAIDSNAIHQFEDISPIVAPRGGQTVHIQVLREGAARTFDVTPFGAADAGKIGVRAVGPPARHARPVGSAVGQAFTMPFTSARRIARAIGEVFEDRPAPLGGPVSLVREVQSTEDDRLAELFLFLGGLETAAWPLVFIVGVALFPRRRKQHFVPQPRPELRPETLSEPEIDTAPAETQTRRKRRKRPERV